MRIAVFDNSFHASGARGAFYELIKQLNTRGYGMDLYVFSHYTESLYRVSEHVDRKIEISGKAFKNLNLRMYVLDQIVNLFRLMIYLPGFKKAYRSMAALINEGNYDVVFVNVCDTVRVPHLLRYLKVRSLFFCHHPNREAYEPAHIYFNEESKSPRGMLHSLYKVLCHQAISLKNRFVARQAEKNVVFATRVLTNSYYTREYLYKVYGVMAEVNYLGIDRNKFKKNGAIKKNYVLSVGGIEPNKRFDQIIRVLGRVPLEKRPMLKIISCRKVDTTYRELVRLAKEREVELSIEMEISERQLIHYYNEALVVIFIPLMEPFGLVPIESMACGTPVIGIREGGVRESVQNGRTGLLVDRNEKELLSALESLLDDELLREELGNNGIQYIYEFWTWEKSADRLEKHLKEVAEC